MKTLSIGFLFLLLLPSGLLAQDPHPLELERSYGHELAAGEEREYALSLGADWFASGRVEQDGVDVVVTVTGPDGERVSRFATVGRGGPEAFRISTEAPGRYLVTVAPASEDGAGAYRIRLERSEPVATTPEGRIDQALSLFADDTPGAIVAVMRSGRVDFARGYGAASLTYGVPFTENTPTNIGSTSKQFTGFALALLQSRGALSLDDDVRDYIPELPDFGETVTLRHLLTHTSGYREFINTLLLGGRQIMEGDHIDRSEVIEVVQNQTRLQNSPGTEFNYNNTAFSLLTVVVERVTGLPFPEWMDREVFGPLGMHDTVVRADPGQVVRGSAIGYVPGDGGFLEVRDLSASAGAGGIYTTVGDLARWMGNFRTGALGGPEVIRTLTTPYELADGESTGYGLGLFIDEDRGLTRWQHGGADIAHRSTFVYYPDLDAGYVVQSNYAAAPGNAGRTVADAFFGSHMEEDAASGDAVASAATPDRVELSREILDRYAARYELAAMPGLVISVTRDGGNLLFELTGQEAVPLSPTSDSTFTVEGVDARITFHREAGGDAGSLTLHQEGDHVARRLTEVDEVVELSDFVGRYFSEELETFYELAVEEDQLVIHHRRFGPAALSHTEGDTFSGTLPVSQMVFERDASGQVTGFHAGNGRARDVWFARQGP